MRSLGDTGFWQKCIGGIMGSLLEVEPVAGDQGTQQQQWGG